MVIHAYFRQLLIFGNTPKDLPPSEWQNRDGELRWEKPAEKSKMAAYLTCRLNTQEFLSGELDRFEPVLVDSQV
jgi:hypothetical protein